MPSLWTVSKKTFEYKKSKNSKAKACTGKMKRIIYIVVAVVCWVEMLAAPRSVEQARMAALQMTEGKTNGNQAPSRASELTLASTVMTEAGEPAIYVFNKGEENGFVLISADDRAYTVLGYSDRGHWDENALPDNLQEWMHYYTRAIAYVCRTDSSSTPIYSKTYTPVAPLCATQWGQNAPYNNLCPTLNGKHCLTGCVATAAAQIMRKYNHPAQGVGSNSYNWAGDNGDSITLSADFGNTTYDWGAGFDTAKLMYHCGIACNMKYSTSNSTAKSAIMAKALVDYFRYDKSIHGLRLDYMPEEQMMDSIAADLLLNRPVLISARTLSDRGHAFVCDGMDANGLLHINWGWTGRSDGYFRISAFNPKSQGAGGSPTNQGYVAEVRAFTHIHPDQNGDYFYSFSCQNVRVSSTRYGKADQVEIYVDTLHNDGVSDWTGNLALRVCKDGAFYETITNPTDLKPLKVGYQRPRLSYYASFYNYPAGTYDVELFARSADQPGKLFPIMRKWLGSWRCTLTVTDDSVFVQVPEVTPRELFVPVDPTEYDLTKLRAYYYPNNSEDGHHHWKLQLSTDGFYTKNINDDQDQVLLLFNVFAKGSNSIIGKYMAGAMTGLHCWGGVHYHGTTADNDNMVRTDADEAACGVAYDESSNNYIVEYRIRLLGVDYSNTEQVPLSKVKAYYGENTDGHAKGEEIPLVNITALPQAEGDIVETQKILRNGILYIIHNGKTYTLQGIQTK